VRCGRMKENDFSERIRIIEDQLHTQQQQLSEQSDNIQRILQILQQNQRNVPTNPPILIEPPPPSPPAITVLAVSSTQKKSQSIRHKKKRAILKTMELCKRFPSLTKPKSAESDSEELRSV
jgi:hypothetical protein